MAFGAVFVPTLQEPYYDFILVEYTPSGNLGRLKTIHDSEILHNEYRLQHDPNARVLEISRMTGKPGVLFSAKYSRLKYLFTKPYKKERSLYIETVYHGSKCFEHGGPYEDIIRPRLLLHRMQFIKNIKMRLSTRVNR